MDKGIQVWIKKRKLVTTLSQTEWTTVSTQDAGTQYLSERKAMRNTGKAKLTLSGRTTVSKVQILSYKNRLIWWRMNEKIIARKGKCECENAVNSNDRLDRLEWECRRQINVKRRLRKSL